MSLSKQDQEMFDELFPNINWLPSPAAKLAELGVSDTVISKILEQLKGNELEKAQRQKTDAESRLAKFQSTKTK